MGPHGDQVLLEELPYSSYIKLDINKPIKVQYTNDKPKEKQKISGKFQSAQVEVISKFEPQPTNWVRPRHYLMHTGIVQHTYDMDILDTEYLLLLKLLKISISKKDFQLLMKKFDLEWHYLTRDLIRSHSPDLPCQICYSSEVVHNSNSIVYCDSCDLTAHQDCYGIPYICDGPFFCRKCILDPKGSPICIFCKKQGGPMKRTRQNEWGHVICAFFIPAVFFANDVYLEPIDGVKKVHKDRWNLTCMVCKQRGACIQCHKKGCFTAMHVYCAQQEGFCLRMPPNCNAEENFCGYCNKHTPSDWTPPSINNNTITLRSSSLTIPQDLAKNPIMPIKIFEIATKNINIPEKSKIAMVKYWALKRSYKGTSLIRQLENEPRQIKPSDKPKVEKLKTELQSLLKVLGAILQREQISLSLFRNYFRIWQIIIKPQHQILSAGLDRLRQCDPDMIFASPVSEEIKAYYEYIKSPMDLSTMEIKLSDSKYITFEDFEHDVELIWKNAQLFNVPNSIYHEAAESFKINSKPILKEVKDKLNTYPINHLTKTMEAEGQFRDILVKLRDILKGKEVDELELEVPDREMNATPEHQQPTMLRNIRVTRSRSASAEEIINILDDEEDEVIATPNRLKRVMQSRPTTPESKRMAPADITYNKKRKITKNKIENTWRYGNICWAKIFGFPFYPAIVTDERYAPDGVLQKKKKGTVLVQFYDVKDSW
eukprot:NODE_731_length_4728_cov_0.293368.p1 type:complete len:712 gc:universal NODE_731_length_4728_cov_0.293368:2580-445(-)